MLASACIFTILIFCALEIVLMPILQIRKLGFKEEISERLGNLPVNTVGQ